jgi:hypothetical protein
MNLGVRTEKRENADYAMVDMSFAWDVLRIVGAVDGG